MHSLDKQRHVIAAVAKDTKKRTVAMVTEPITNTVEDTITDFNQQ